MHLSRKQANMDASPSQYNDLESESLGEIILRFIEWFFRGLVQPIYSLPFYRTGIQKGLGWAIFFLLFFAVAQTAIIGVRYAIDISQASENNEDFPNMGDLQSITIEDGIARVEGTQPWVATDQDYFFGIDTTGEITEIDTRRYNTGFLITRTELHTLSEGDYETYKLEDFNATFGNPIVINEEVLTRFWDIFSNILLVVVIVGSFLWNFVARLAFLAILAMILWAITQTLRKETEYSEVLITGIYVSVPLIYLNWVWNQIGLACFCVSAFVLMVGWIIVLRLVLPPTETTPDTPVIAGST
jgi:hypothetical protein